MDHRLDCRTRQLQAPPAPGREAPTKTEHSERTIKLLPDVRAVFQTLLRHKSDRNQYVFVNAKNGGPINHSEWPKSNWKKALKETGIRPRKFYATRHTFISTALTKGLNIKFIAEYCGTSVAMIEQRYGRFLKHRAQDQLRLLESAPPVDSSPDATKGGTLDSRFHLGAERPLWNIASPTGFEPGPCDVSRNDVTAVSAEDFKQEAPRSRRHTSQGKRFEEFLRQERWIASSRAQRKCPSGTKRPPTWPCTPRPGCCQRREESGKRRAAAAAAARIQWWGCAT